MSNFNPEKSQFDFYSFGIVAEDKEPGSPWVEIIPVEHSYMNSTEVKATSKTQDVSHTSANAENTVTETTGNTVRARWKKLNSYLVTPPSVQKGDEVVLLRLGQTDIFFWMDFNEANVKNLENLIWAIPADPTNAMADDLSNAYVFQVSSKDGLIQLRTSSANKEKASFLWQFNLRDGTQQTTDHKGNKYWINSTENDVGLENANGSKFNIIKEEMFGYAKKRIRLVTDTLELVNKTFTHTTKGTQTVKSSGYTQTTDGAWSLKAGSFKVDSEKNDFTGVVGMPDAKIGEVTFSIHVHRELGDGNNTGKPTQ